MGLLEAICVTYLRRILLPDGVTVDQIVDSIRAMKIEIVREACTMGMLLAVAWLAAARAGARTAMFFLMFGIWDIVYYVGLRGFAGWPSSVFEWDCLFLIPVPWFGPVLAPVLISLYFMSACTLYLVRENQGRALRLNRVVLASQASGFSMWYWTFVKDSKLIESDGYEAASFGWGFFAAGGVICLLGLWWALRCGRSR